MGYCIWSVYVAMIFFLEVPYTQKKQWIFILYWDLYLVSSY